MGVSLPALLLFLNGVFALVFELIWCKRLEQLLGVGLFAVTLTVSCFLLGLALGGWLGAKLCASNIFCCRPKQLLIQLQACTAVACLLFSIFIFSSLPYLIIGTAGSAIFMLTASLLTLPALGIGILLPAAIACFAGSDTCAKETSLASTAQSCTASILYTCNLFGSLAGAAVTVFYFMPTSGLWHSALIAGGISLVALCILNGIQPPADENRSAYKQFGVHGAEHTVGAWHCHTRPHDYMLIFLVGISGFAGIALEIIYVRIANLLFNAGVYSLALVLICYLLSNAAGAWTAAQFRSDSRINKLIVLLAPLFTVLYIAAELSFLSQSTRYYLAVHAALHTGMLHDFTVHILTCAFFLFVLEFVPIFLLGMLFIAVLQLAQGANNIGYLICSNNTGSIAGAWITGFLLIPNLCFAFPHHNYLDFYREGLNSSVAVLSNAQDNIRYLKINGLNQGSIPIDPKRPCLVPSDLSTHLLLANLPLSAAAKRPLNVCLIGYGTGTTAGAVLEHSNVRQLHIIELEKCVLEAAKCFNNSPYQPRIKLHVEDARSYLLHNSITNDVIICQPSEPWVSGASNLFTQQYWQICRRRLAADGVLCQWIQLYGLRPKLLANLCRTFISVFPHTIMLHQPGAGEIFLLAGNNITPCTDKSLLLLTPQQLNLWCRKLANQSGDNRLVTDDNLLLEYAMPQIIDQDPESCIRANLNSLQQQSSIK